MNHGQAALLTNILIVLGGRVNLGRSCLAFNKFEPDWDHSSRKTEPASIFAGTAKSLATEQGSSKNQSGCKKITEEGGAVVCVCVLAFYVFLKSL